MRAEGLAQGVDRPPFLDAAAAAHRAGRTEPPLLADLAGARVLQYVGDSVTTDHICPAGRIPSGSPAGRYLRGQGVDVSELNSYASRRGNWQVMRRGGFANPRLRNRLSEGGPGGLTADLTAPLPYPVEEVDTVADRYAAAGVPLVVLGGQEYGTGSSRDWAAKVTALLGVRAVIAESYERIHRSNLVGMGVLPLQFADGDSATSLGLDGSEVLAVEGLAGRASAPPRLTVTATHPVGGAVTTFTVTTRLDTPREQLYHRYGGVLPYVLRSTLERLAPPAPADPA